MPEIHSTLETLECLIDEFRETKWPDEAIIKDVEETLCNSIGLGDHQRIVVGHEDKDHLHIHIGINKIHPKTFTSIEPYYDHYKLSDVCQDLERNHGLESDRHIQTERQKTQEGLKKGKNKSLYSLLKMDRLEEVDGISQNAK